jgi:5-methylcytosine-specific restriction endonuclease McrA
MDYLRLPIPRKRQPPYPSLAEIIAEEDAERTRRVSRQVRRIVWQRDGGRCVECEVGYDLHFDHIIPWSKGGSNEVENIQLLCVNCNLRKAANI